MPIEIDTSNFSLQSIRDNYLDFELVAHNMDIIIQALLVTLSLALLAEVIGIVLGLVLLLFKIARSRLLRFPAQLYIDIFRGLRS